MVAERAGVPAVINTCENFINQAHAVSALGGVPYIPVVNYPGHIDTYDLATRETYISELVAPGIEEALTTPIEAAGAAVTVPETAVVFKGTFEEVLADYREKMWTDGLPIIPPTLEKVEEFLEYTDYPADAILTRPLEPSYREATPWAVAVKGVMAGCRPESMPVLIAMVKCLAEPNFRAQDSSSTPGWETLTILNGPIIKQLGFNYEAGVMNAGFQSNTSVGRFWKMFQRNVMEIRVDAETDKGTFGIMWPTVMAENEDFCRSVGWETHGEHRGFKPEDNVVSLMSLLGGANYVGASQTSGENGKDFLDRITDMHGTRGMLVTEAGTNACRADEKAGHIVFAISPVIAQVIAKDGYSKDDMAQYIWENAKLSAEYLEGHFNQGKHCKAVEEGKLPRVFCESEDPNRLIPVFYSPDVLHIVATGDPGRNRCFSYMQNNVQGTMTTMKIELPKNWDALYNDSQLKKDIEKSGRRFL